MKLDQSIRVIFAPTARIADHRREIGYADNVAILHGEIRNPLRAQETHLAFRAWIEGTMFGSHALVLARWRQMVLPS
jgi:hypothetical protein